MCQATMGRLLNHFESCQVRKVTSLLTEALRTGFKMLERMPGTKSKYTASGTAEVRLCTSEIADKELAYAFCVVRYSCRSSAERNSVLAFERITSTASSRDSPPISVSHTNASMPSVAPIP